MEKRYINQNRYKTVARSERKKRTVARTKNKKEIKKVPIKNNRIPKSKNEVKRNDNSRLYEKFARVFICSFLILIIACISRLILKDESSPFIPNIFVKKDVNDQSITIGIEEEDLSTQYINNIVLKELDSYAYPMLLKIDNNYTIEYGVIKSIDKVSNKEYTLHIDERYGINAENIKQTLEEYETKENIYYSNVENISSISAIDNNTLKIYLKQDDNCYIYNLCLPIYTINNGYNLNYKLVSKSKDKREYVRIEQAETSLVNKVTVVRVSSLDDAVQKYKDGKIDVFFANSKRAIQLLGKYEYNISSYRNGKTLFLLGNPNSELYNIAEVRKAIAYGIDREEIINNVFEYSAELIDLPYIYNKSSYQYDIYAADNLLLSNGFKKKSGVYSKILNGKSITLYLDLLVNKKDKEKIKVAEYIKKDLKKIGIGINIEELSSYSLKNKVNSGNYDLVLADVYINSNPDISFLKKQTYIASSLQEKLNMLNDLDITKIDEKVNDIAKELYNQNIYYGIKSDNIYMIYSKSLSDISDPEYMNLFGSIMKK